MAAAKSNLWYRDSEDEDSSSSSSDGFEESDDGLNTSGRVNSTLQSGASQGISTNGALINEVENNENTNSTETELIRPVESSVIHIASSSSSMVDQLREQLHLRMERRKQPALGVKPKLMEKSPEVMKHAMAKQPLLPPQQSLRSKDSAQKPMPSPESTQDIGPSNMQQSRRYPIPAKPINAFRIVPTPDEKPRILPKPPPNPPRRMNFDMAADPLPDKANGSADYDYESMKQQPLQIEQRYQGPESMKSANSTQALTSGQSVQGSDESLYHSPNISDPEDNEEVYEIISEKPDDHHEQHMKLIPDRFGSQSATPVRPAPPRPSPTASLLKPKKYDTCRSIACQPSRPLPLPPRSPELERPVESPGATVDVSSYKTKPWFHNIGRAEATALIEGGNSSSSTVPPDGYFLLRPAAKARMTQSWTLVLWYKNKTYNIAVRRRPDSQYALGTVKPKELSFVSIEEMIDFYKQEELVLNSGSGDTQVGKTRLTETPPKNKD